MTTPSIPNVQNASWSDRAIDRFILAELEKHGLAPAPQANRETLLRRLTFNLTGLAPTLSMMHSFVNDDREGAWEHVIDLTLDSPHFGERWARHWLDVARYNDGVAVKVVALGHDHGPRAAQIVVAVVGVDRGGRVAACHVDHVDLAVAARARVEDGRSDVLDHRGPAGDGLGPASGVAAGRVVVGEA